MHTTMSSELGCFNRKTWLLSTQEKESDHILVKVQQKRYHMHANYATAKMA